MSKIIFSIASLLFISAASAETTITYQYDALGRLVKVSDTLRGESNYSYDDAGNRSNVTTREPVRPIGDGNLNIRLVLDWQDVSNFFVSDRLKFSWQLPEFYPNPSSFHCVVTLSPGDLADGDQVVFGEDYGSVTFQSPSGASQNASVSCSNGETEIVDSLDYTPGGCNNCF